MVNVDSVNSVTGKGGKVVYLYNYLERKYGPERANDHYTYYLVSQRNKLLFTAQELAGICRGRRTGDRRLVLIGD